MEYVQLGVWGNIPWKYELNPFSGLGGDVKTSFDNETKTDEWTDKHTKIKEVIEITRYAGI